MSERVCVFIDSANFLFALIETGWFKKINYYKLANSLCSGRKLVRVYFYDAIIPPAMDKKRSQEQQRFLSSLDYVSYLEKRFGNMKPKEAFCKKCKSVYQVWVQKGVDVRLAVDLVSMAAKDMYDVGIVISADGDLEHAFYSAKDLGKHIEWAYFTNKSRKLQNACDRFIEITKNLIDAC